MAAVFLLLQVQAELNEDICDVAFDLGRKLVEQYFKDRMQVISNSVFINVYIQYVETESHRSRTTCSVLYIGSNS